MLNSQLRINRVSEKSRLSVATLANRFYYCRTDWVDGTTQFANLIKSYLLPEYRILDLGAGSEKKDLLTFEVGCKLSLASISTLASETTRG